MISNNCNDFSMDGVILRKMVGAQKLLLTLLTTNFRFGGWRYTIFVLTNQNHCYMPKLNGTSIHQKIITVIP